MKLTVWHERSDRTGVYSVRYYDPDTGKRAPRIKCYSKEDMLATEARIQSMLLNHTTGKGDPEATPLVVMERYLLELTTPGKVKKLRRASTIEMKRNSLVPYLETVFKMSQITDVTITAHIQTMQAKGYAIDTIAIRLRDLRAFINWCRKQKILKDNPFMDIHIPTSEFVGHKITTDELKLIMIHASPRLRPFLILALETGARRGELLGAEWSEIDWINKSWVIPALKCKTNRKRTIPLPPYALTALESLPRVSNYVFGGMTSNAVQKLWKRALRDAGITNRIRIHDLRHTWASNWKGQRSSLKAVAGWVTDAMMDKYTHTELLYIAEETERTSKALWSEVQIDKPA